MKGNLDEMASGYAESATIAERSATMTQSRRSLRDRSVMCQGRRTKLTVEQTKILYIATKLKGR